MAKMPPTAVVPISQMNVLELGLRNMRRSHLRTMPEFIDMYQASLKHFTDIKIAHLVGTPQDTMEHYVADTRFFYLLVQMVGEVLSHTDRKQVRYLRQVYKWFRHNKHVLHCGPHFGRKRFRKEKRELGMPPKAILKLAGKKDQEESKQVSEGGTEIPVSARVGAEAPPPSLYSPLSLGSTTVLCVKTIQPAMSPSPPTPIKKLQPTLPDVSSPYKVPLRSDKMTKEKFRPASLHPDEERANRLGALKKWDEYLNRKNVGQERLSRLQYVGRSGLPGIPRYTAHDRCLNAEEFTQSIIDNYSHVDDMTKMNQGNTQLDHLKQDIMVNMPLNDFYDRAKNYFPIDYPKYPAFQPRVKSAPLQDADSFAKLEVTEKRSKSARRRSHKKEEAPWVLSRPIKLDTIVNLIDSVTDEMQEYKERMTPEPLPGFRQPAIKFNINERPLTAPFTGLKPPDGLVHPSQQWKPAFLTETHVAEPHVPITSINVLYDDFPSKHLANLPCSTCLNVPTSPMKGRLTSALVRMSVTDSRTLLKRYVYVQPTRAVTKQIHLRNFH